MNKVDFSKIRNLLGKSQKQMSQLMGVSLKAIQSFEQGWRNIPVHVERQALMLLTMKKGFSQERPCWEIMSCPAKTKEKCPAWEFQSGRLCWFINGTICHGEPQTSWEKKMVLCRACPVFMSLLQIDE